MISCLWYMDLMRGIVCIRDCSEMNSPYSPNKTNGATILPAPEAKQRLQSSWLRPSDTETIDHAWWTVKLNSIRSPIRDVVDLADLDQAAGYLRQKVRKQIETGGAGVQVEFWRAPRSHGVCRFVSLLDVFTRTTMQALGLVISQIAAAKLSGSVLSRPGPLRSPTVEHSWYSDWSQFFLRISELAKQFNYIVITDFSHYFDSVSIDHLREVLKRIGVQKAHRDLVCRLSREAAFPRIKQSTVYSGLPQLYDDTPALLGNLYPLEFDSRVCQAWGPESYARWMDDIAIGFETEAQARIGIAQLSAFARELGLNINPRKTRMIPGADVYKKYLHLDLHKALDEVELRVVLEGDLGQGGRIIHREFVRLEGRIRQSLSKGAGEVLLRRLYRLAALIRTPRMLSYLYKDLLVYPGSAAAIAQYIAAVPWHGRVSEVVHQYLNDPANTCETIEVGILLSLLHRVVESEAQADLSKLADSILSGRLETLCDTSTAIAALILLRYDGKKRARKHSDRLRSLASKSQSGQARRYLLAAIFMTMETRSSKRLSSRYIGQDSESVSLLWEFLSTCDFDYESIISKTETLSGQ